MAAIVYQTNKKTGVTYAYESVSFWDKKKQQSRARRKCIGRVDPETQKIVPTRKRGSETHAGKPKKGPVPISKMSRNFYGATYLFEQIGKSLGITDDLKVCFPESYKQVLSIAYYLIMEDKNPLSRFPKWSATHKHPNGKPISSQRSSDLFASINEEARGQFFRLQGKRRIEQEYWAYDTTSISSYSKCLKQVRYGWNKDYDPLAQINLALLFGQESHLPFYYRKMAGNITDVKTVKKLLLDMDFLGFDRIKLVMDRGFYSADNINDLYKNHLKFLIATKCSLKMVKTELDAVRDTMRNWNYYSRAYDLYAFSQSVKWAYSQERPYKGDTLKGERRMYLHLYYSGEKALEHEKSFNAQLHKLQSELESGKRNPDHEKQYAMYFEVTSTPVRGTKIVAKDSVIKEVKKNYGYFALVSNEVKDPIEALEIYRNKDLVEKAFGNLKERLNLRRLAVSSEQSLDGKLFVEFIALIFLSFLKKKMQDQNLFKDYTMQGLLDELDVIECFEHPGHQLHIGEISKRQIQLYAKLGIDAPSSLQ